MTKTINLAGPACPVPFRRRGQVILGYGTEGKLSPDLISELLTRICQIIEREGATRVIPPLKPMECLPIYHS